MISSDKAFGIVPSDILIRTAIIAGLDDLRKNPFLLDYCFNWFSQDSLTSTVYGDAHKNDAKEWFLKHKIVVRMNYDIDEPKFPLVSIGLKNSTEDQGALGDVNYDTSDEVDVSELNVSPTRITGKFTPDEYDSSTGIITVPSSINLTDIYSGMIVLDTNSNVGYVIENIIDTNKIKIADGSIPNLTNMVISSVDNFYIASLEALSFRETYDIKCFAQSTPLHAHYLHTIVQFVLLRYKEQLLEARGFDRSTISSGPMYVYQEMGQENTFGRDIIISGYVRQYWPKMISPKLQNITINGLSILGGGSTPVGLLEEVENQGWWMEDDDLGES